MLAETQILKFYQPLVGNKSPSRELLSPVWGLLSPFGGLSPFWGLQSPLGELNKPYLGDFVISSAASEAKTPDIARTPSKAVDTLYAQIG